MWQIRTVTVSSIKTVIVSRTGDLNSDSYCDIYWDCKSDSYCDGHWDYNWFGYMPNCPIVKIVKVVFIFLNWINGSNTRAQIACIK